MVSKVTIGDIRGLLVDADKRHVLRLLPEMDEVCRGYTIAHLGNDGCSIEDIANQVWILNATDWMRGQKKIFFNLCKTLDYSGFDRVLHTFSLKIAEDFLQDQRRQGRRFSKKTWKLLEIKRRWMDGEVSDEELDNARYAYLDAYRVTYSNRGRTVYGSAKGGVYGSAEATAYWAAHSAASWAASRAVSRAAGRAADGYKDIGRKKQVELLGDMMEDSVGIERGVKGKNFESKLFKGG